MNVRKRFLAGWVGALLLLGAAGCEKDSPALPTAPGVFRDLRIVAGNNQTGSPGEELPQPLVVEAVDGAGGPVVGVRVRFAVVDGGGVLADTAATTGRDGRAQTRLTLGSSPGIQQVRATVQGLAGLPPTFTAKAEGEAGEVSAGPLRLPDAAHFSLAAEKLNLPGGVRFGLADRITAFVFDAASNPVTPGTLVRFHTSGGGIEEAARTDSAGRATATLTTAQPLPEDGRVVVSAQTQGAGGAVLTAQMQVLFSGPTSVRLIQPARFEVAPGAAQTFLFFVGDAQGHPLAAGTRIRVEAAGGTASGQIDLTLPDTQSPEATLFSVSFQADPAGEVPRLTITVDSPNGDAQASFVSGAVPAASSGAPAALSVAVADSALVADGASQTQVVATVLDSAGRGVSGVVVQFSASAGTVESSGLSDETGQARALYRSPLNPGASAVQLEASAGRLRAQTSLGLVGVRLSLSASADTIAADGNAQAKIRAQVQRSDGVAIANGAVHFSTTLGTLSAASVETDAEGLAEVLLVAGTEAGKALVRASYAGGLSAQVAVILAKGPPASIAVVGVEPPAISVRGAGGNETAIVTFEVRDARGNAVADGEGVLFRFDAPPGGDERVGPERTTTVAGRVQAAVSSGTRARTLRLIAEAPLASGDTVRSTPVPIAIHGGLPDQTHFSLAANPLNLAGRVVSGLESTITAYVFDKYSNPVRSGTSIRFRTDGGGVQGSAQTDEDGQAAVKLFTAEPMPPGPAFLATITGQTVDESGQEIEASTLVLFSGATAPIRLTGAGADTVAAGQLFIPDSQFQVVSFSVSDLDGNPIMGGSTIRVTSDVAGISGDAELAIPDALGGNTEYAIFIADPSPQEDPPDPPKRGSVLIQVRSRNGDRQLAIGVSVD